MVESLIQRNYRRKISCKMSKKKKLSNEEKLSSVIGDISAITNKNRGKKSRPGNSSRDIVLQRNETGVRVYPNRRRRGSSQSLIKAKGKTKTLLCLICFKMPINYVLE